MRHTSKALYEQVKAAHGGITGYKVSLLLNVQPTTVYRWRDGRGTMSEDVGVRVANLLGLDPIKVVVDLHIERIAHKDASETFPVWAALSERLETAAA